MNEVRKVKIKPPILVIEDDPVQLKLLADTLEMEDLRPICCQTAQEALRACQQQELDVAILDLQLPDMDGLQLLRLLKKQNPEIKVIINTGYASLESAMAAVNEEAFAYTRKAEDIKALLAHVHRAYHVHLARHSQALEKEVKKRTEALLKADKELKNEIAQRKQERNLLRTLIDNLPDFIFVKDTESRFVISNITHARALGATTPDELIGKTVFDFFPEELATQYYTDEQAVIRSGRPLVGREEPIVDATGNQGWLSTTRVPLPDSHGKIVGLAGVSRDITRRKQVEAALRRSNRQLALLNRAGQAVISTLDPDQVLTTVLEEVRRFLDVLACLAWLIEPEINTLEAGPRELVYRQATDPQGEIMPGWQLAAGVELANWVIKSGQSLNVPDIRADGRHFKGVDQQTGLALRSILSVPLQVRGEAIGVLQVVDEQVNRFNSNDEALLEAIAATTAIAIENSRLFKQTQAALAKTEALYHVSRSLIAFKRLPDVLQAVVDSVAEALPANCVLLYTLNLERRLVNHFVKGGPGSSRIPPASFDELWAGLSGWVLRELKPALSAKGIPDSRESPEVQQIRAKTRGGSIIVVPLRYRGEMLGTMTAINHIDGRDFTEQDVELMVAMANQAAIAIENARLFETERAGREQLQALSHQLVEVHETERRYIAHELHDEIGQALTGLKLLLEMIAGLPADADQGRAKPVRALALVDQIMVQVHDLSLDLRPPMLDDLGLLPTLLWYLERYSAQTGVRVIIKHSGMKHRRFAAQVETAVYRIVQESLTNVARHAGVREATVRVLASKDRLRVQIVDQGAGFDPAVALATQDRSGLVGMQERATLLGGQLKVESTTEVGTRVIAELPLAGDDGE